MLGYVTRAPLHCHQIGQLRHAAGQLKARVLLLPRWPARPTSCTGRTRWSVRSARPPGSLPPGTLVVPVPLRRYPAGAEDDLALRAIVAAAYGATHLLADDAGQPGAVAGSALLDRGHRPPGPGHPGHLRPATGPTTRSPRCGGRWR